MRRLTIALALVCALSVVFGPARADVIGSNVHLKKGDVFAYRHGMTATGDVQLVNHYDQRLRVIDAHDGGLILSLEETKLSTSGAEIAPLPAPLQIRVDPDGTVLYNGADLGGEPFFLNRQWYGSSDNMPVGAVFHRSVTSGVVGAPSQLTITVQTIDVASHTVEVVIAHDGQEHHGGGNSGDLPVDHTVVGTVHATYRDGVLEKWVDSRDETQGVSGQPPLHYHVVETIERASESPSAFNRRTEIEAVAD